jgi:hypothetical protein
MTRLFQQLTDVPIGVADLERWKIEDLAAELKRDGYDVRTEQRGLDEGFDIVANKGRRRIAIEVKANSELRASAQAIKNLRMKARDLGFDEFRLVLVRVPLERRIIIQGIEKTLPGLLESVINDPPENVRPEVERLEYELLGFLTHEVASEVQVITNRKHVGGAQGIEIKSVDVGTDQIRVAGSGVIEICGTEDPLAQGTCQSEVPFEFDMSFGPSLTNRKVNSLEFQIAGFSD